MCYQTIKLCLHGRSRKIALQDDVSSQFAMYGKSLWLYKKHLSHLTLPTGCQVTMRDPLSRLVPVPFYVLPYKAAPREVTFQGGNW